MRKAGIIFFGITLGLVAVEFTLRLLGVGYNVIYTPPKKPISDYKIFCIGESTTWGLGAKDPFNGGYPKQLEDMLNKEFSNKTIHCFFNQMIGQNTTEILLKLPFYIEQYQPNLIIFMVGANNWWNLDKSNILLFNNKNTSISNFTLNTLIFLDRFRVWKLIKWIRLSRGLYKERWNYWFPKVESPEDLENQTRKLYGETAPAIFDKLAEHDISEMVKLCKSNNINVIICNYPMEGPDNLNFILKKIAEKFQVPFVDNYIIFKNLPNLKDYLWKDKWHPNEKGYKMVAENIHRHITENAIIEFDTE